MRSSNSTFRSDLKRQVLKTSDQPGFFRVRLQATFLAENGAFFNASKAPSHPHTISLLPTSSNLLHVSVLDANVNPATLHSPHQLLLASTADRNLHIISPLGPPFHLSDSLTDLHDSPILSCAPVSQSELVSVTSSMSGQVVIYRHRDDRLLDRRRDHQKYVVQVATHVDEDHTWVATAGWDGRVFVYLVHAEGGYQLGNPISTLSLPTNPEALIFVREDPAARPLLLLTRRDSTHLHFYGLPPPDQHRSSPANPCRHETGILKLVGKQNLAPHSNSWVAFSPSSIAICPTDSSLLAVATSTVPHMKLMFVRLLWPSSFLDGSQTSEQTTQASQAVADLRIQEVEQAAILACMSTLAPQTPYSTPQVVWRPSGSGVWVNGDDGVLRGIEAKTGKIIATLKDGHELGSKIRSIWCGCIEDDKGNRPEWVVSGGFDHRLVAWSI